jgi:transcriptional regulator
VYSPPYNRVEDRTELLQFLRANNFPVIITRGLRASHLPANVHEEGAQLVVDMHMARPNGQWQAFDGTEVLIVFTGPHAYISPRWYEDKERVPTWNYTAVHLYGVPELVEDRTAKHAGMRELVSAMDSQWLPQFDALNPAYVERMLGGIVNFRIPVTRIETRWKLSQNRGRREMELIAEELRKQGESALAELTLRHLVSK